MQKRLLPKYTQGLCFSPRLVLTAKEAGAQLAHSNTFVLSPPATSRLWHGIGYSTSARPQHLCPTHSGWANMSGVGTGWYRAIITLWTTSCFHRGRIYRSSRSTTILPPPSSLTSPVTSDHKHPVPQTPLTSQEEELCAYCTHLLLGSRKW